MLIRYLLLLIVLNIFPSISHSESPKLFINNKQQEVSEWNPKIILGTQLFSKRLLLQVPDIGTVTDIYRKKEYNKEKDVKYIVSGNNGAIFVGNEDRIKSKVKFSDKNGRMVYVDSNEKGDIAFLNRGGGWQPVSIYNKAGELLWTYGGLNNAPNDMAAGDVDANGKIEFVIGFNGSGGIGLLNQEGNLLWQRPDNNVWHVELVDIDSDGNLEIVHSNAAGHMIVRNSKGELLNEIKIPLFFSEFSFLPWPTSNGELNYLISENQKLWIVALNGSKKVAQFNAPLAPNSFTKGTVVYFEEGKPPYFAAVVEARASLKRAILYIYSPNGELIYQEILPTGIAALSAIPLEKTGKEILLVGGEGVIWEYTR